MSYICSNPTHNIHSKKDVLFVKNVGSFLVLRIEIQLGNIMRFNSINCPTKLGAKCVVTKDFVSMLEGMIEREKGEKRKMQIFHVFLRGKLF